MFVSFDFEVESDDLTPEEAIKAARDYCAKNSPKGTEKVRIPRGPESIEVLVSMTLIRASHAPIGEP